MYSYNFNIVVLLISMFPYTALFSLPSSAPCVEVEERWPRMKSINFNNLADVKNFIVARGVLWSLDSFCFENV